ncbi:MAG: hypothetical protein ACLR7D_06500 [Lachnospira eligens]
MFIFNVQDGPDEIMESHGRGMDIKVNWVAAVVYVRCKTKEGDIRAIDEIGRMREELYDIDGAVVKIDHIAFRQEFPAGNEVFKQSYLHKYPGRKVIVMDDILVDVGEQENLHLQGYS